MAKAKIAAVFPGQGSQYVGMGKELAEKHPIVAETFAEADEALKFSLSRLCFEGPEEELTLTRNTQPALLVTSVAIFRLLEAHGFAPDLGAGHSLGEYSALVAAGAMSFADAVRTVRLRGELMEEAVPPGQGTMAAILGLERELVEALCREVAGVVEPATYNSPGQVVVAGDTEAVHALMERALAKGARRAQLLKVSGPFHSSLLAGAGQRLGEWLASIPIAPPKFPVYSNVTAAPVTTPEEIRACLARQVSAPVRWEESVRNMVAEGATRFVEVGPGRVLSGLIKRIERRAELFNVESEGTFETFLKEVARER
ncbi:MAG TPA: ACP S-malonyltransferase [Limnochordia bacterium]|nr:ACP S-malonyltransferase [Limnochordia bacterium]